MSISDVLAHRRLWWIECADVMAGLAQIPDNTIHCVVTSPPYFGLRDYQTAQWEGGDPLCQHRGSQVRTAPPGSEKQASNHGALEVRSGDCLCGARRIDRQIGLEPTPADFVETMVQVFREVRRVLRPDGVCWINLGFTYASDPGNGRGNGSTLAGGKPHLSGSPRRRHTFKPKDLIAIPWLVALALQEDGWWLRSAVTLCKIAPMPESVRDRPTNATEMLYLLTKRSRYFYDQEELRVPHSREWWTETVNHDVGKIVTDRQDGGNRQGDGTPSGRNLWNWWEWAPEPSSLNHYAAFPTWLPRKCIRLGASGRGCCPECGAPWRRVTRKMATGRVRTDLGGLGESHRREALGLETVRRCGAWQEGVTYETLGWQAGCTCNAGEPIPCLVLDPFAGSGTTILVAHQLGRRGIGIDLNPEYVNMAHQRIIDDAPMVSYLDDLTGMNGKPVDLFTWQTERSESL